MQEVTLHLEQNTDFHTKEAFKTLRQRRAGGGRYKLYAS